MKKHLVIFSILLISLLSFSLMGCGSNSGSSAGENVAGSSGNTDTAGNADKTEEP